MWVGDIARPVGPKISPLSGAACALCPGWLRGRARQEDGLNLVPELAADDRLVLAGIGRALVNGIADIDPVVEQLVDVALVDGLAVLVADALGGQFSANVVAEPQRRSARRSPRTMAASVSLMTSLRSLTS